MTEDKTPPSEMIRVPTALIPVVRRLSKLHRQGHTIALLQGLEELMSKFDSNTDINVAKGEKSIKQRATDFTAARVSCRPSWGLSTRFGRLRWYANHRENSSH